MVLLRFGTDSQVDLALESDALVAVCDAPGGQPLADVRGAAAQALAEPLGFPPLVQAAVTGDRVVLALNEGVPQAPAIVAETIATLEAAGVQPADITVLRTLDDLHQGAADPLSELPETTRNAVTLRAHDPRDRDSLSYLAASAEGLPIYINRAIFDADLVVSIGVLRLPGTLGYHGVNSGLFPTFSDAASLGRFCTTKVHEPEERTKLCEQVDEVAWLLGSRFTIQVVPGAGDDVLHVLAGDAAAMLSTGTQLCQQAWSFEVPERAALVVAAIGGDAAQQTWSNFGRALTAAGQALSVEGDVIVCTELTEQIGPALQRIIGADDLHVALREIAREKPADAPVAAALVRAMERGKVFLISNLDEDLVEELGLLPLSADSVSHVAGRYDSCIAIANAQFAEARPAAEAAATKRRARKSRS